MLNLSPFTFGELTVSEFNQAYRGYMWGRERLLKDMAWMIAAISSHCRTPNKKNKKLRVTDFFSSGQDPKNNKNPFYKQIMGLMRR